MAKFIVESGFLRISLYMVICGCAAYHYPMPLINRIVFKCYKSRGGVEISGMKISGVKFPRPQFLLHGSTWMCRPSSSHAIDRDNDRQLFFSGPNEFCILYREPMRPWLTQFSGKKLLSEFLF